MVSVLDKNCQVKMTKLPTGEILQGYTKERMYRKRERERNLKSKMC